MNKITEYELVDHGIETADYFTGAGTAYTHWTDVFIGAGSDPQEAFDDATEQLAMSEWDIDSITITEEEEIKQYMQSGKWDGKKVHFTDCPMYQDLDADCVGCERYYYLAIYVR